MAHTKTNKTPAKTRRGKFSPANFFGLRTWWNKSLWNKFLAGFMALIIFSTAFMYGVARWYMAKHANEPIVIGATFIPGYASYFDLDPKETMEAMIDDLGLKRLRLVSYWDVSEAERGKYDFTELDWQFKMAEEKKIEISLALGLRQPRWPECHMPKWAETLPKTEWFKLLENYITAVVERYKHSPVLESYQLENEYFLKVFGICPDHSRQRLVDEYKLVKRLDPQHTLVVSMSNNAIGTPIGEPTPDMWAISVYKRVWDKTITKRYFEYPVPAWYYAFRAGWTEATRGGNSFIHELQAEAWIPDEFGTIKYAPIEEQNKSMNAERLRDRFEYGRATGMKTIDLWGVEWWYWRKVKMNEPSLWDVAKDEVHKTNILNNRLK